MTEPPVGLLTLYRLAVRVAPASHRSMYMDEQMAMLVQLWREERPARSLARVWWATGLVFGAFIAAIGVHLDQRRARQGQTPGGGFHVVSDLRFTVRSAARSPWYSITVIGVMAVTMALAIATLAIVDGVLFRPLPFPAADRLVRIQPDFEGIGTSAPTLTGLQRSNGASPTDLEQWRLAAPDVPMTGFRVQGWGGLGAGINDWVAGMAHVQPDFFEVLGVRPLFGGFTEDDFRVEVPMRPVLVTYDVWQSRYGGRGDVVGAEIVLNHVPRSGVRVVGVMPEHFVFPSVTADVAFLTPMVPGAQTFADPVGRTISAVVARLPPSMDAESLAARLQPALAIVAALLPPQGPKPDGWSDAGWRRQGPYDAIRVVPLAESLRTRAGLLFQAGVLAAVLLVLIAAVNVSSVMTARALEREREFSVRRSLGAGALQLAGLWAVEAGLLLLVAAAVGLTMAPLVVGLIVPLLPDDVVLLRAPVVDVRIAGIVAAGLAMLVGIVSLVPIRRSCAAAAPADRGSSARVRSAGRVLVIAGQVAVAFALTVLGASLVGSVLAVYATEQPIRTASVVALSAIVQSGEGDSSTRARLARVEAVRQQLLQIPGVRAVAASGAQVLSGGGALPEFVAPAGIRHPANTDAWPVTEGFYETLAPQVVAGRVPTSEELRSEAPLIVVSQRAADAYWPGQHALGQTLEHYWSKQRFTVVGVVADVRWLSWDEESPIIYAPYAAVSRFPWVTYFVHADGNQGEVLRLAIAEVEKADPLVVVSRAASLGDYFRETVAIRRFQSWLFGGFATAALLVVGAGLLGLLAMSAARRTREVGIRCALGATPGSVVAQLVREQMVAVVGGLVVGAGVAIWALRLIESWLYQLTPADPRIWLAALACLLVMAGIGILIPAVRASRTDPLVALRAE